MATGRMLFGNAGEARKRATEVAVQNLRDIIRRFGDAALSDDPTSTKKMLEIGVEVQGALEAVGKAKTGTT